ncbi:MAG: hypothetical protein ACLFTN_02790 [Phycisphaerae bacterium]
MKRNAILVLIVLAVAAVSLQADDAKGPSKDELEKIAQRLEKTTEARFQGDDPNASYEKILKGVVYTEDTAAFLPGVLSARRPINTGAAVTNQLLQPLLEADTTVIRRLISTALTLQRRYVRYIQPPKYRDSQLRPLVFPDNLEKLQPTQALQVVERVQQLRQRKLQRDMEVAFRNRAAANLQKTVFRLMVRARDGQYDRQLLAQLKAAERSHKYAFMHILYILRDEAGDMPKAKAKWWFDEIKRYGDDRKYNQDELIQPGEVKLRAAENSFIDKSKVLIGYELYQTADKLAKQAGVRNFKHPGKKEIKKVIKKRKK